ncbi:MAG: HD domain-containing protein [Eubacteriales bacterium]|nr:HD domain-containing protein [Eubacteriales bacterium]
MHFIESFHDGDRISDVYLCRSRATALTKAGKEYDNVILQDKTGQIDSKIWDLSSGGIGDFDALDFVYAAGQVTSYNGALQFKIERIRRAEENEYIAADYIPCSRYGIEDMYGELMEYVKSIKNPFIKKLLTDFFVEDTAFISSFKNVSAAKTVHHGFSGGLLEHSLSVTRICVKMAENYDYLNRDLLVACAMLHDAGKVKELSAFPKNDYTDEGNFIGHIVMGYEMVMEKIRRIEGFPEILASEIGHCILAHHGELEYGSPKKPSIAEALALSLADNMDAKMETMREVLDTKDTNDWLGYNRWLESNVRKTQI